MNNNIDIGILQLCRGGQLEKVEVEFTTYGTLSPDRDNAVLVCHALTGQPDVAVWWPDIIGEGTVIDTSTYFVIAPNLLGSCYGTTGPESIDPGTGDPYHRNFPLITTRDQANAIITLLEHLNIPTISIAIGGSLGGMVLLEIATMAPKLFRKLIVISARRTHTAWRIGFSSAIRRTIEEAIDTEGDAGARRGMALARHIGILSYRSREEFNARFGRDVRDDGMFQVESYLVHQGVSIVNRFSPYAYITLTRAMELHDCGADRDSSTEMFSCVTAETIVIGASSDLLYAEEELITLAKQFPRGRYAQLEAPYGHDSFLVATSALDALLKPFLNEQAPFESEVAQ